MWQCHSITGCITHSQPVIVLMELYYYGYSSLWVCSTGVNGVGIQHTTCGPPHMDGHCTVYGYGCAVYSLLVFCACHAFLDNAIVATFNLCSDHHWRNWDTSDAQSNAPQLRSCNCNLFALAPFSLSAFPYDHLHPSCQPLVAVCLLALFAG